ncbi:MAG: hypothetical protein ILM98_11760 [Kiritimatiellae bacterium]|nr:hypothetical protein [Kiritimatiellia bacterium]
MNVKLVTTLAVMAAFAVPSVSSAISASHAYVQRGLVAQYDGIDNAGTGSHDSSATTWKNLTGDTSLDATMGASTEWEGGNGWKTSGNTKPFTVASPGLAPTFATTNFTVQFACVPGVANKRMCYFGQYKTDAGINIEQTTAGKLRFFRNTGLGQSSTHDKTVSNATVVAGSYLSSAICVSKSGLTFYNGGTTQQTINGTPGAIASASDSVIGGEVQAGSNRTGLDATYGITFRGTYHAFRVYNVTLTAAEIAWNAGLDAVRFNGADAATTLGDGYTYDAATDTLTATLAATAGDGGAVAANGGATGASASVSFDCDGTGTNATFTAVPDREHGYVFDRWTGDTAAITAGSPITPEITVSSDSPVALVANFRRNGDAADGLKFDISFTGDTSADGITFSSSNADDKQGYLSADVALPVLPTVTNSAVNCIYLPQPTTETNTVFRQDARKSGAAVTGEVATVFCRFRWDGSVLPGEVNYPAIIMNGYTSWSLHPGEGFCLRMRADANSTNGRFSLIFPNNAVAYNNAAITTTGPATINQGRWVDVFVSVYPSPTDPTLSNADVWYCEVPSWNEEGHFNRSQIGHRHFGDGCNIVRMNTTTQKTLIFGSEPNAAVEAITGDNRVKCFRGAIAAAKGWNRLLTTNEMWTVMAGLGGVQSFTDLETAAGRTYETVAIYGDDFKEGRNGTQTSFLGGDTAALRWRALTASYKSNTLLWNAPKDADPMPVVFSTKIGQCKSGNAQPIHLEVNGTKVWPADTASREVVQGDEIKVEIGAEYTYPGLNELKWVYDTELTSNYVIFDRHKIKLVTPANPFVITIR